MKKRRIRTKKRKNTLITEGAGHPCPKCKRPMQHRTHSKITEKILRQPYFFSEWHYCRKCKHLQHYEKYKIFPKDEKEE